MSSLYVRDRVREWLATAGYVLPFFDTINRDPEPTVRQWSTVLFLASVNSTINYCGLVEERGTFDFLALGKPGTGDAELVSAAEHDAALLVGHEDASGALTLVRASPPEDFMQATDVPWYSVAIAIEYRYVIGPPVVAPV